MKNRKELNFENGIMFKGSNCEIDGIGHDIENAVIAYDFMGTVLHVCPRPWCMEVIDVVRVDDLTRKEYDELMNTIEYLSNHD